MVLVLAIGVAAFFAGRAYVRSHLDEWRDRSPVLNLAISVLGLRGQASSGGPLEAVRGDSDLSALPDEIVTYRAGESPVVSVGESMVVVFQEADEPVDVVVGGLSSDLLAAGWEVTGDGLTPGGRALMWASDRWGCTYEVVAGQEAVTEIWARCAKWPDGTGAPRP